MKILICCVFILFAHAPLKADQPAATPAVSVRPENTAEYVLGPDDQIKIWSLGMEEISDKPVRVDPSGDLDLPIIGKVHAAGLTVEQLRAALVDRLSSQVRKPQVSVEIVEFGSQPISVMGEVSQPGVFQLHGRKTLAEVLSLAGGLSEHAGARVHIARQLRAGPIPLSNAKVDPSGKFYVADVRLKDILTASNPAENIPVCSNDLITVPAADVVYVMGEVRKPGPVALNDRDNISVLQAVSMAEGFGPAPAAPQAARIVRLVPGSNAPQQIPVDLKKVLAGKAEDIALRPNDILVVPASASKKAMVRAVEAAVQTATGVAIWRMP